MLFLNACEAACMCTQGTRRRHHRAARVADEIPERIMYYWDLCMHSWMPGTVSYMDLNIGTLLLLPVDSHLVSLFLSDWLERTHTHARKHTPLNKHSRLSQLLSHTQTCTFVCVSHEDSGEVGQAGGKWGNRGAGSEPSQNINNG